jgi:hypothetical protein
LEHDGARVGQATGLAYELRNGVGYLMGHIDDFMGKVGLSLQYSGTKSGGEIRVGTVDHVALVDRPRDPVAVFADSEAKVTRYRDSADSPPVSVPESIDKEVTPEVVKPGANIGAETGTEVELTDEVIDQLYDSLFKDPKRLADLVQRIKGASPEPEQEPTPDPTTEPKAVVANPTRIIIKPRVAQEAVVKKTVKVIQRPFKGLP